MRASLASPMQRLRLHRVLAVHPSHSRRHLSSLPREYRAAQFAKHGDPESELSLVSLPLPPSLPAGHVLLRFLASPINPSDVNIIEGVYHVRPELPAVAGSEGVAEVIAVGGDVVGLTVGDRVIPARAAFGTWRTHAIASEDDVAKVDPELSIEDAATLAVNPCTAFRLLHDFVQLRPGDAIIQNGATSAVGLCVAGLCEKLGLVSINVIRDRPNVEQTITHLHEIGATHVLTESSLTDKRGKELLASLPKAKLALNCVGGTSAAFLTKHLDRGATMVTYGGMSKRPVQIPTSSFIFNELRCEGFWLTRWNAQHSSEEREAMRRQVSALIKAGAMKVPVERVPFNQLDAAIRKLKEPHRGRKILLDFDE